MKKKTLRKVILLWLLFPLGLFIYGWIWTHYFAKIDTEEVDRYYDLLKQHAKPAHALILSAGVSDADDLKIAMDRIKDNLGLNNYYIDLTYGNQTTPPAFVENVNKVFMTITVSRKIKFRREQLNLLVHELSHISVWSLEPMLELTCGQEKASDQSIFKGANLERVVDVSGMFRGGGILTLNGLSDDVFYIPGMEFSSQQRMFGYLKPEHYGYLLARYAGEHGINPENIEPFLETTGKKYFEVGLAYYKRSPHRHDKPAGEPKGIYWCPLCGNPIYVNLAGNLKEIHCSKCSFVWNRTVGKSQIRDAFTRYEKIFFEKYQEIKKVIAHGKK